MKKILLLLTISTALIGCSVNKKPEFLRVENIKVLESDSNSVTLTADAFFNNPNDVGGELQTDAIKVFVNDNELATVSSKSFKVPAKKEFSIPLKTTILTKELFNETNLGGLIGSLFSKKLKVQYKGDIKYKVLGFSHTYNIDKTEEVKIKL